MCLQLHPPLADGCPSHRCTSPASPCLCWGVSFLPACLPSLQALPADIRDPLVSHPQRASLLEVVLDLGRRPEARFLGQAGGQFLREAEVGGWGGWLGWLADWLADWLVEVDGWMAGRA